MTDELTLYGQGTCAACPASIPKGHLMCRTHWFRVPMDLRGRVLGALDAWNNGSGALGELRDAQEAAVAAVKP